MSESTNQTRGPGCSPARAVAEAKMPEANRRKTAERVMSKVLKRIRGDSTPGGDVLTERWEEQGGIGSWCHRVIGPFPGVPPTREAKPPRLGYFGRLPGSIFRTPGLSILRLLNSSFRPPARLRIVDSPRIPTNSY